MDILISRYSKREKILVRREKINKVAVFTEGEIYDNRDDVIIIIIIIIIINILAGKLTRKRLLGTPSPRWEGNFRIDLKEAGISTRNWADSDQNKEHWRGLVNVTLNLRVP